MSNRRDILRRTLIRRTDRRLGLLFALLVCGSPRMADALETAAMFRGGLAHIGRYPGPGGAGALYALDAATGAVAWTFSTGGERRFAGKAGSRHLRKRGRPMSPGARAIASKVSCF
jgi:hypothetical protein